MTLPPFHVPPEPAGALASACNALPSTPMRFSLSSAKNPID